MSILKALIMGIVQGLTEFLPVSSSGHMAIMQNMLGMTEGGNPMLFTAFAHIGTLIALVFYYFEAIGNIFKETRLINMGEKYEEKNGHRRYYTGKRLLTLIILSTVPMLLIIPVSKYIDFLATKTVYVGFALILTGFALRSMSRMEPGTKNEATSKGKDAILIGICQCVSVLPGLSRAGITMMAGLSRGHTRKFSADYFALISVPALIVMIILELVKGAGLGFEISSLPAYIVGLVAAMVSSMLGISLLRKAAAKGSFGGFAYYCWVAGALTVILTFIF